MTANPAAWVIIAVLFAALVVVAWRIVRRSRRPR